MSAGVVEIIIAIFGSSLLSTIATHIFTKKRVDAEAGQVISTTVLQWATLFQARIDKLEKELGEKNNEIIELHAQLAELKNELDIYKSTKEANKS